MRKALKVLELNAGKLARSVPRGEGHGNVAFLPDGWEHKIELEALISRTKELFYPCCIDGKRACPPEDSGGPFGYLEKLKIFKNKKHPEHEEVLEWMGKDFDPEYFDLNEVNTDMRAAFVSA